MFGVVYGITVLLILGTILELHGDGNVRKNAWSLILASAVLGFFAEWGLRIIVNHCL